MVYLVKFYNENGLVFSKIGKTNRTIKIRIDEEKKEYKQFNIKTVEIVSTIEADSIQSVGAESMVRARLIQKYPESYKEHDRFFRDIKKSEFEKIVKKYLKRA